MYLSELLVQGSDIVLVVKRLSANVGVKRCRLDPGFWKIPTGGGVPTHLILLPEEYHGQRPGRLQSFQVIQSQTPLN